MTIINTKEQIARLLPHLAKKVDECLIAMPDVEVIQYVHQEGVWSQG